MLTYHHFLQNEFLRRRQKNKSYSLRAFARDLGISQPFLTQILHRKKKLGDKKALQISQNLGLSSRQNELFFNLVRYELTDDADVRKTLAALIQKAVRTNPQISRLSEDEFSIIADWWCFAIVELVTTPEFQNDPTWIARRLGISQQRATEALERLLRVGMLQLEENRLVKKHQDYVFKNISSRAIRKHHHQTLELARNALEDQSLEEREFSALTVSVDPRKLKRAKEMIRDFTEEFMVEMQMQEPHAVYKLSLQFFRLDKKENA